ncbi:DNA alkylation repair protein [Dehalogenimonas sp. THU2]|uniref:DNA alkylation repair protein n=1 Tax=Dehalogenimonas sp. THU2 TaxID=3151121 RepID=UPI003218DCCD
MSLCDDILTELRSMSNPANIVGMARFGINPDNTLGVSIPALRAMAKLHRRNHELAIGLWNSGIHEARILASLVDDPKQVTIAQMEAWIADFDSWDVCDQVCSNLWEKTPYAYDKAIEWSHRQEVFVKRAGFVLMARLAVGDKKIPDEQIKAFLPEIVRGSNDARNFVKKAVNWALRQIGKRSTGLNALAIAAATEIARLDNPAAHWIAADALRELQSAAVQERLKAKSI